MKKVVIGIVLSICLIGSIPDQKTYPVYIFGQITSDEDSIKLHASLIRSFVESLGTDIFSTEITINKNGEFKLTLPSITHPARFTLTDRYSYSTLLESVLIEPGDSIYIKGHINSNDSNRFDVVLKGRGHSKAEFSQKVNKIGNSFDFKKDSRGKIRCLRDTILLLKFNTLKKYKNQVSPDIYKILQADIYGSTYLRLLKENFINLLWENGHKVRLSDQEVKRQKARFDSLFNNKKVDLPQDLIAWSPDCVKFLYEKAKLELILKYHGATFGIKDLYNKLHDEYKGILKENLLAYCMLNGYDMGVFWEGSDADEFTSCLENAVSIINTPQTKEILKKWLYRRGKGAPVFNFTLPADSSNKEVRFSDFHGKVVLIDMWGYNCTACHLFAKVFHEKVYQKLANNPDFAVISIMTIGEAPKEKYLQRLRGAGGIKYTYPEYVNLFGGKGEDMGRKIEEYYGINGAPFVILTDKRGNIYSSTIPFFINSNSPNVEKLIKLIEAALSES